MVNNEFVDLYTKYADLAIKNLHIESLWRYVQTYHTPGLGYHNLNYLRCVMGMAYKLAMIEGADEFVCVVAAMFHDVGHTGKGGVHDEDNIEWAITHLHRAYNGRCGHTGIIVAIESTQYDGQCFPIEPFKLESKVLRDADLCLPFLEPQNAKRMIIGLGEELGRWGANDFYSVGLPGSIDFYSKVMWYTPTMQARSVEIVPRLLELYKGST